MGKKLYKIIFGIVFLFVFTGLLFEARADWTVPLNVTLNGNVQLPIDKKISG